MKVVYVAGTGRSGSTVFAQALQAATGYMHVGELRYLWDRGLRGNHLCECGETFRSCPFWAEVLSKAYGTRLSQVSSTVSSTSRNLDRMRWIPQNVLHAGRRHKEVVEHYGDLLHPLYSAISEVSGSDIIIDSSKDPSYLFAIQATRRLDLSVVHLVRDSRAVAHSWTRKRLRPEIYWKNEYMRTLSPRRSATIWMEYNLAIELYRLRYDSVSRLRYEDFAACPDGALTALRHQLADGAVESATPPGTSTFHSFSGNPRRFENGPLKIELDNAWIGALGRRERRSVTRITAPLLKYYGYRL